MTFSPSWWIELSLKVPSKRHRQIRSSVGKPRSLKSRRASHLDTGTLPPSRLSGADSSRELILILPSFPSSGKNCSHVLRTSILRPELASSSGRLPLWSTVLAVRWEGVASKRGSDFLLALTAADARITAVGLHKPAIAFGQGTLENGKRRLRSSSPSQSSTTESGATCTQKVELMK